MHLSKLEGDIPPSCLIGFLIFLWNGINLKEQYTQQTTVFVLTASCQVGNGTPYNVFLIHYFLTTIRF